VKLTRRRLAQAFLCLLPGCAFQVKAIDQSTSSWLGLVTRAKSGLDLFRVIGVHEFESEAEAVDLVAEATSVVLEDSREESLGEEEAGEPETLGCVFCNPFLKGCKPQLQVSNVTKESPLRRIRYAEPSRRYLTKKDRAKQLLCRG